MTEQRRGDEVKESTPQELANGWLSHRETEVQKELDEIKFSRKLTLSHDSRHSASRPSYVEAGSTDASDWDLVEGEEAQWPEERDEKLEYLSGEQQRLDDELTTIEDYRERVEDGDLSLITELSEKEKIRLEELQKQREKREKMEQVFAEKRAGKEMVGTQETGAVLQKLVDLVKSNDIPENKPSENGWELARNFGDVHIYDKNDSQIEFRLSLTQNDGFKIDITTFPGPILPYEKREKGRVDVGHSTSFSLRENKIYNWNKCKAERSYKYGYPDRHLIGSEQEEFDKSDFDSARNVISELYSDMEVLASNK